MAASPPATCFSKCGSRRTRATASRDVDLYMTLPVTPSEAVLGAQVQVPMPTGGAVSVTVPRNARGGLKLRLKGCGFAGKPPGDLYLLLEIALLPADRDDARKAYEELARATAAFNPRRHLGA